MADEATRQQVRLLVMGRPGSGKGTQGSRLAVHFGVAHVSAGDLLRAEVDRGGSFGRAIGSFVTRGALVPDTLVDDALDRWLRRHDGGAEGFVLDGYPRSVPQALTLERMLSPHRLTGALELALPAAAVRSRLMARGRGDDEPAAIECRLGEFDRVTRPLLAWLADRSRLVRVDANPAPDVVFGAALEALAAIVAPPRLAPLIV